jgi:DNA-binding GntR family transcriptional regulator
MTSQDAHKSLVGRVHVHSASQAAAQLLRKAIISGTLKPGDRLVELKLAVEMGVGQPTLREALKELEYEGFVRKTPQRGTYVTKLEVEDYRKILMVRVVLEELAFRLAAKNLTPAGELELVRLVEEMGEATAESDLSELHERHVAFHRKIWNLSGNEYLTRALECIAFPLFAFALLIPGPGPLQREAAVDRHKAILEGICSRDPAEASRAFMAHTVRYWNEIYHLELNGDEGLMPASIQDLGVQPLQIEGLLADTEIPTPP